jgi:hypothetical protein
MESSGSSERSGVFVSSLMDQGLSVTVDKSDDDAKRKCESRGRSPENRVSAALSGNKYIFGKCNTLHKSENRRAQSAQRLLVPRRGEEFRDPGLAGAVFFRACRSEQRTASSGRRARRRRSAPRGPRAGSPRLPRPAPTSPRRAVLRSVCCALGLINPALRFGDVAQLAPLSLASHVRLNAAPRARASTAAVD